MDNIFTLGNSGRGPIQRGGCLDVALPINVQRCYQRLVGTEWALLTSSLLNQTQVNIIKRTTFYYDILQKKINISLMAQNSTTTS